MLAHYPIAVSVAAIPVFVRQLNGFESAAKFQSEFIEKKLKELFQAELRIKNGAMDEDSSMVMFVAKF